MNVKNFIAFVGLCVCFTACSQTAGGDISTTTEISPTTNFQLDSVVKGQGVSEVDSATD